MTRSRRSLGSALACLAVAALAAGCGEKDETLGPERPQSLSLMLDYFPNADHAGIYSAQAGGHFRNAGLDVVIRQPPDPAAPIKQVAAGRVDLAQHEPAWRRLLTISNIGPWTDEKLAFEGQGRDDQLPAGDLAYIKLVGKLALLGRRATVEEVRAFFAPYEEFAGLAGWYALMSPR